MARIDEIASNDRFESDSNLVTNDWGNSSEEYRGIIRELVSTLGSRSWAGRSDIFEWIDKDLRPLADRVNREFAKKYGWDKQLELQFSARESGPGDRVRASDSTTVRSAIHFGQQAGLSEISGQSNGTERTTATITLRKMPPDTEARFRKAWGKPVTVFGMKPPVFYEKKSTKPNETKDPEKK